MDNIFIGVGVLFRNNPILDSNLLLIPLPAIILPNQWKVQEVQLGKMVVYNFKVT